MVVLFYVLAAQRLVLAKISAPSTFGLNLILIKSTFAQPCSTSRRVARSWGCGKAPRPSEKRAADGFFVKRRGVLCDADSFEDESCDRRWRRASCSRRQCHDVAALADCSLHRFLARFARACGPSLEFRVEDRRLRHLAQFAGDKPGAFFMRTVEWSVAVL